MKQSSADHQNPESQSASVPVTPIAERIIKTADAIASGNTGGDSVKKAQDPTRGSAGMIAAVAAGLQLSE